MPTPGVLPVNPNPKNMKTPHTRRSLSGLALCTAALFLGLCVSSLHAAHWALTGSVGVHDPSITRDGSGPYWVFATGNGIHVKRSSNGLAWADNGQVFGSGLAWWKTYVPGNSGNDVWAPDVRSYNGKWWLYYSISTFGSNTSCIGLASKTGSLSNSGWTDNGLVIRSTSSNSYNAIDPNLVIDAANQPWLVFGSWWNGIYLTRLDAATMKPTGSLTNIARRSGGIEAPHIVYRSGYYYLFVSVGVCCQGVNSTYKIAYGRSSSITGPYLDKNGVNMLSSGGTVLDAGNAQWKGPGGQSIHGTGVIARHAYDANANGAPKLLISDLNWSGGWPSY